MAATWADIFKCNFLFENVSISIEISLNFVPKVRRQAITWTNDDSFQWHIYASPGLSELTLIPA